MRKAAFVYDPVLSQHVLKEDHVFRPSRLHYTFELLEAYGAFQHPSSLLVAPRGATEQELLSFHSRDYVEAVQRFSRGEIRGNQAAYGFSEYGDNPIFPGMYEASSLAVGASLVAAELVLEGKAHVAFNIAGGLHHAGPNFASGFCIFNDPVVIIKYLLNKGRRVVYVDIDAHHGDGVQFAFYDTDRVLTVSLHESGRYLFPGTGEVSEIGTGAGKGYAVNLPLAPYTDDDVYLWAFEEVIPSLLQAFRPDIVVTQLGTDTHYLDPLTHLALTTRGFTGAVKRLGELAPGWIALGGGGYEMGVVARCWTLAYGIMLGQEWPDEIPPSYQERYGLSWLRDRESPRLDASSRQWARRFAEDSVRELKRLVFPLHGLALS